MPNASKLKYYELLIVTSVPKVFEADNISLRLSTANTSGPKEFNPKSFKDTPIPFEVSFDIAEDDNATQALEVKISGESLKIKKIDNASLSVKVNDSDFQEEKIPLKKLIDHINRKIPYNLKLKSFKTEPYVGKSSTVSFMIDDNNVNSSLILSLWIEYSYEFKGNLIFEHKQFVISEGKEYKVELPEKNILGPEIKIRVLDIQNNEINIQEINGKKTVDAIISKELLLFDGTNEISIKSPENKTITEIPEKIIPARIRGKILDLRAKRRISNCQIVLYREKAGSEPIPFFHTKTNLNGDFSEEYPHLKFEENEKVYAVLSINEVTPENRIPLILVEKKEGGVTYFCLKEYNLIVLGNLESEEDSDCNCHESEAAEGIEHKCNCNKEKNVSRLPEYENLINDDQYTQDIGGSCVNFTKPNRTLSESTFYAIVRTTEPKIIGLDLMRVDDYIRDIERKGKGIPPFFKGNLGFYPSFLYPWRGPSYKVKDRFELDGNNLVDWDETPLFFQAVTLAFGHLIQYRQRFYANGYSLGNVITTEGLAPGQVKKIAVLDWKRNQSSSRNEQSDYRDELEASTDHTQDFEELQSAMLQENSAGGSSSSANSTTAAMGFAVGAAFPPVVIGVAGGVGTTSSNASSNAWQNSSRNTSASMNSHLSDKTKQAAKNIRSQRVTVITSDTQMESVGARTEVLANYNHCHSINNVFFEVLRHVAVRQDVTSVSECLFVPLLISEFTEDKIFRWKEHLKSVMLSNINLRKRIGSGFDALERKKLKGGYDNFPAGSYADEKIEEIYGEFEMELNITMPNDEYTPDANGEKYKLSENKWKNLLNFVPSLGGFNSILARLSDISIKDRVVVFNREYAPKIAANLLKKLEIKAKGKNNMDTLLPLDFTLSNAYTPDKKVKIFVRSKGSDFGISRKAIEHLSFDIGDLKLIVNGLPIIPNDIGSKAVMKSAKLYYRTKYSSGILCDSATVENDLGYGDPVVIYTPCNVQELKNQKAEDNAALDNLIGICNENLERLHASIWMSMSEQKVFFLLDGIKIPKEINGIPVPSNIAGKSVASIVNPKPIGVVGNSLVLKVTDGVNADPIYRVWNRNLENAQAEHNNIISAGQIPVEDLLEVYQPLTPVEPYQISFPTGGYFMETVRGACNSCEKIDDSRFWKWEEHPIPLTPSDIQPVSLDSRFQQPLDTKPTEFPQSNISIQNIPQGPQPTGLDASLNLLGKSNLFRDDTGLAGTQNLVSKGMDVSKGAMDSAINGAVNAMNSAAAYDLAKDKQKSENYDKLMKSNLPPNVKEQIAKDFADDTYKNSSSDDIKGKADKIINNADTSIKENAKGADTFNKIAKGLSGKFDELSVKPNGEITAKGATLNNDSLSKVGPPLSFSSSLTSSQRATYNDILEQSRNLPAAQKNIVPDPSLIDVRNITKFMVQNSTSSTDVSKPSTVVIEYFGADNDLFEYSLEDLNEITNANKNNKFTLLALIDFPDNQGLFVIELDSNNDIKVLEQWKVNNNNNIDAVKVFLARALKTHEDASKVAIGFWGHGLQEYYQKNPDKNNYKDLLIFPDINVDGKGNRGQLTLEDIGTAFDWSFSVSGRGTKKIDIIFLDACLLQTIEVNSILHKYTKVTIASQNLEPGDGMDYRGWLKTSITAGLDSLDAVSWAKLEVDSYENSYKSNPFPWTHSGFKSDEINLFEIKFKAWVEKLLGLSVNDYSEEVTNIQKAFNNVFKFPWEPGHNDSFNECTIDLIGFLAWFKQFTSNTELKNLTDEVINTCLGLVIANKVESSLFGGSTKKGVNGISIWFPKKYKYTQTLIGELDDINKGFYPKIDFVKNTRWVEFCIKYLNHK